MTPQRIAQLAGVAIGVAYLAFSAACSNWKQVVHDLTPATVIACQIACAEAGRADLAPLCSSAGSIADVFTQLSAEHAKLAAKRCTPDAGAGQ